jgi:hypothetical protein
MNCTEGEDWGDNYGALTAVGSGGYSMTDFVCHVKASKKDRLTVGDIRSVKSYPSMPSTKALRTACFIIPSRIMKPLSEKLYARS